MNGNEYQKQTANTAIYNQDVALPYTALGVVNEAGEVAGKVKKYLRGDYDFRELQQHVLDEAGDCLWYLARLCDELGLTLDEVMQHNIDKLESRKQRNVIKGNGDNR